MSDYMTHIEVRKFLDFVSESSKSSKSKCINTSRTQLDKNAGRIVSLAWSSQNQFAVAYQAQEDNPKNGVIQERFSNQ